MSNICHFSLLFRYKKKSRQRFISVAHDVWDGKRKQMNGLMVFFTNPESFFIFCIPVALTPPSGKTVIELCKACMCGLDGVGIEDEDSFRSIGDNCSTVVKAGKL